MRCTYSITFDLFLEQGFILERIGMHARLCWIVLLFLGFGIFPEFAFAEKYALVIGIHYDNMGASAIPECATDAKVICEFLQKRYAFSKENITLLISKEATIEKITKAFNDLIDKVDADDQVFIYYSGHGTQVDDDNGDETKDHLDEAIVTYDPKGKYKANEFIRDDQIGEWIQEIRNSNAHVVVLMDSCYSGTGMKAFDLANGRPEGELLQGKERSAKFFFNPEWQQKAMTESAASKAKPEDITREMAANRSSANPTTGSDRVCEDSYQGVVREDAQGKELKGSLVFFSACAEKEVSWTIKEKGQSAFTYCFLKMYEKKLPGDSGRDGRITFEEAFQFVKEALPGEKLPAPQTPTLEQYLSVEGHKYLYPYIFIEASPTTLPPQKLPEANIQKIIDDFLKQQKIIPMCSEWKIKLDLVPDKKEYMVGDWIDVKATPNHDGYLLLLNVTEKGDVTLLFPNGDAQENQVKAGQCIQIPPAKANWGIQIQEASGQEWMVAYLLDKNPFAKQSIPDTFRKDILLSDKIKPSSGDLKLQGMTVQEVIEVLGSGKLTVAARPDHPEKWTKAVVAYKTIPKK